MDNGRLFFAASAVLALGCFVLTKLKRSSQSNETESCPKVIPENDCKTGAISYGTSGHFSNLKSDVAEAKLYEKLDEIGDAKKCDKDQVSRICTNFQQTSSSSSSVVQQTSSSSSSRDDVLTIEVEEDMDEK